MCIPLFHVVVITYPYPNPDTGFVYFFGTKWPKQHVMLYGYITVRSWFIHLPIFPVVASLALPITLVPAKYPLKDMGETGGY